MKLYSKRDLSPPISIIFTDDRLSPYLKLVSIPESVVEKIKLKEQDVLQWLDYNEESGIIRLKLIRR